MPNKEKIVKTTPSIIDPLIRKNYEALVQIYKDSMEEQSKNTVDGEEGKKQ
jgi:hypothetical protein